MKEFKIIKITAERLDEVLGIYSKAREFMMATGNPNQWKTFRPYRETLEEDIRLGQLYGIESDGSLYASFVLMGEDPVYDNLIEGAWLNDKPYHTIHRVASDGREKGMLGRIVEFAKTFKTDLRIDTHDDNKVMQHLLQKHGFVKCGRIPMYEVEERVTFHYVMNTEGQK